MRRVLPLFEEPFSVRNFLWDAQYLRGSHTIPTAQINVDVGLKVDRKSDVIAASHLEGIFSTLGFGENDRSCGTRGIIQARRDWWMEITAWDLQKFLVYLIMKVINWPKAM